MTIKVDSVKTRTNKNFLTKFYEAVMRTYVSKVVGLVQSKRKVDSNNNINQTGKANKYTNNHVFVNKMLILIVQFILND